MDFASAFPQDPNSFFGGSGYYDSTPMGPPPPHFPPLPSRSRSSSLEKTGPGTLPASMHAMSSCGNWEGRGEEELTDDKADEANPINPLYDVMGDFARKLEREPVSRNPPGALN